MLHQSSWDVEKHSFPWEADAHRVREERLQTLLMNLSESHRSGDSIVHVIWSAGCAGFNANQSQTSTELKTFNQVASFAASVKTSLGSRSHFHMLSSAGGLFEGVRGINLTTKPCPARLYGQLKAEQEAIAIDATTSSCSIYRPTSVYSTVQRGKRCGLIPTVIWNSLLNQTTSIYGNNDTLRDYIWADDIGRFIAGRLADSVALTGHQTYLLATAVPTPINRIVRLIEDMLMRPVPLRFIAPLDKNTRDITVSASAIPPGLVRTDLATAIRQIYLRLLSQGVVAYG